MKELRLSLSNRIYYGNVKNDIMSDSKVDLTKKAIDAVFNLFANEAKETGSYSLTLAGVGTLSMKLESKEKQ